MEKNEISTYEQAFSELRDILTAIQENAVDIDELALKVERAHFLVEYCKEKLRQTEFTIGQLNQQISTL